MSNYVDVMKKGATEASRFDLTNATGFSVVKEEGITTIEIEVPDMFVRQGFGSCRLTRNSILLYTDKEYREGIPKRADMIDDPDFERLVQAEALLAFIRACNFDRIFTIDLYGWGLGALNELDGSRRW